MPTSDRGWATDRIDRARVARSTKPADDAKLIDAPALIQSLRVAGRSYRTIGRQLGLPVDIVRMALKENA